MKEKKRKKVSAESLKKAKNFLFFLRPYSLTYGIGFIFLIGSSSVSIAIPYLLGKILGMDPQAAGDGTWNWFDPESLYGVLSMIGLALPIQALFSFFRIYCFSIVTQNTLRDLRVKAYSALVGAPITFFDQNKVGELTSRVGTDLTLLQETLTTTIAEFIRQFIIIGIALTLVIYTSPALALTMLLVIPFVALSAVFFGKFIRKLSKQTQDEAAKSNGILEESLASIKSLKSFTNEWYEIARYGKATEAIRKVALKTAIWRGVFVAFILIVMFGSVVFIIWRGIELVKLGPENGGISSESFFQFIMMTVMIGASIGAVPDLLTKIQNAIGSTENLMDLINGDQEKINKTSAVTAIQLKGDITFEKVSFSYPSRPEVKVLDELSFEAKAGEQIAIVGSSGGGKSTIANLILQFYKIDGGNIYFDGKPASNYDLSALRAEMAYVPQEIILLGGTIEENIRYGKPDATFEEIKAAARKANALQFIDEFPDGFETLVGDRGIQLSGGQRQRVAIARAILKNPSILILDEATSALDSSSETLVQEAINELMKGRTSIVIAHRLSTLKNADQIIVLDNGKIIESGSHEELVGKPEGAFNKLKQLQEH